MKKIILFIVEYTLSVIYMFFKITKVSEAVFQKLSRPPLYKRLSRGVVKSRLTGNCLMVFESKDIITIQKYDYFKDTILVTKMIGNIIFDANIILTAKRTTLQFETNGIILSAIKRKAKKYPSMKIKSKYRFDCCQPFEKLLFISPSILRDIILNKKWEHLKKIFRNEKIYDVEILFI